MDSEEDAEKKKKKECQRPNYFVSIPITNTQVRKFCTLRSLEALCQSLQALYLISNQIADSSFSNFPSNFPVEEIIDISSLLRSYQIHNVYSQHVCFFQ